VSAAGFQDYSGLSRLLAQAGEASIAQAAARAAAGLPALPDKPRPGLGFLGDVVVFAAGIAAGIAVVASAGSLGGVLYLGAAAVVEANVPVNPALQTFTAGQAAGILTAVAGAAGTTGQIATGAAIGGAEAIVEVAAPGTSGSGLLGIVGGLAGIVSPLAGLGLAVTRSALSSLPGLGGLPPEGPALAAAATGTALRGGFWTPFGLGALTALSLAQALER
jgi:hypothetical protein